ncbi:Hypothetical predicted protein [Paramuricea clavata]|uniref:Uncharacterized protein n=1 Tax=Paramuricea clavata TaxID=317549 RepID=A0A6S7HXI2_PARCT|nr:Hypothetical predicted protein [Paramuricea clavata]
MICPSPEFVAPANLDSKDFDKRKREVTDDENDAKRTKVEIHQISEEDEETSSTLEELSKHLIKLREIHTRTSQLPPEVWEKLKSLKTLLDTMVKSN